MKSRLFLALSGATLLLAISSGCALSLARPTALVVPTTAVPPPTAFPVIQSPPPAQATAAVPTAAPTFIDVITAVPRSGPYAVFDVNPDDVLNVRVGPGADYGVVDTLAYNSINVFLTGLSQEADGGTWVQIERPGGGVGWVNSYYLIEHVSIYRFCEDERVAKLLNDFKHAILTRDGELLSGLVSPPHGLAISLYRLNDPVYFHPDDARWVFDSTYQHDWGPHPARGDNEVGSFQEKVLPRLEEVFNASYQALCEDRNAIYLPAWPENYDNLRMLKLYKPATSMDTLDFRIWLVGIDYIEGQPYLAALIHIEWEP